MGDTLANGSRNLAIMEIDHKPSKIEERGHHDSVAAESNRKKDISIEVVIRSNLSNPNLDD